MAEVYRSHGSLSFKDGNFILDGTPLRIFSGTMHYFRVVPEYWRDRFRKMKACGLNTVETYVPWNLHEEYPGEFNFSGLLDVREFIRQAGEEGLHVIFRPGPYICAEWDWGGMPSWLLKDPNMKVRSNYPPYVEAVRRFFDELLPRIVDLQHTSGGPIIAVQVENEYGSYSNEVEHLHTITEMLLKNGIKELLLTSDNIYGLKRAPFFKHALPTANFPNMEDGGKLFNMIREWSSEFPLMVMEFWPGWFDHWGQPHKGLEIPDFEACLSGVLDAGGSFNMYMFHGGTNFGFMAGANYFEGSHYKPDVTSYDYDAPLSEAGDVTPKYMRAREIILKKGLIPQGIRSLPDPPPNLPKKAYGEIAVTQCLDLKSILSLVTPIKSTEPVLMENLDYHKGYGQCFGYIFYQADICAGKELSFTEIPKDRAQVFVNGEDKGVLDWLSVDGKVKIGDVSDRSTLDVLVENHGRVNYIEYGSNRFNEERKGISGCVTLDGKQIKDWRIFPLDFKPKFLDSLRRSTKWKPTPVTNKGPVIVRTSLQINSTPQDTFLDMKGWNKGIVFLNGFNLGRYWKVGPTRTLYVPAPLLREGDNEILIFEQHGSSGTICFIDTPLLGEKATTQDADTACYPTEV
ncbi:beta-galactosidase-1-like protein 2 [Ostrea edulis]|uniref:beta-galactosidase-1-like protein 2 n=1 Tax=Ostrea edulis TaxID=37623 RepID=UPI0024AFF027|nr:beta-galactosidase-1-like protein 2 [Ostrea edulis]XP_048741110.2 beta-galactosidase-1-like protein 2 [Ostrea edulis]XP_056001269.1 beta-galactosidase-1-like protein 2 [Ostrea edulis]